MKPVVLLLSTYPYVEPRHGGQVRLANIAAAFKAADWQVESIAVYDPDGPGAQQLGKNDLPFPSTSPYRLFRGRSIPLINDLLTGEYAVAEDGGFPLIKARLPHRIDAIHVEQPWMWPSAHKIRRMRIYKHAMLIFGSANIEFPLKKDILSSYGVSGADDVINSVEMLERQAACEADLVLAVTQADFDVLAGFSAKHLLLAPNGISPWHASEGALKRWRARLPKSPFVLYVASAHPPNFTGFTACVGDSLGCIPPDSKLIVAGSVCEHIYHRLTAARYGHLNHSRLELLHVLSDEDLAAVKTLAHAFLLPIPHGGGSNIKTAEALFSGAYVIGSETAFRGFEDFVFLPEVAVASTPQEFQAAIRDVLQRPLNVHGQPVQGDIRYKLRWDQCLAPIPESVARIIREGTT